MIGGIKYAVMQSLQNYQSIANAIENGLLTRTSVLERLRFAYDLSATISALHHNGLLVKSLSDESVFVDITPTGYIRPLISELKSARDVSLLKRSNGRK